MLKELNDYFIIFLIMFFQCYMIFYQAGYWLFLMLGLFFGTMLFCDRNKYNKDHKYE